MLSTSAGAESESLDFMIRSVSHGMPTLTDVGVARGAIHSVAERIARLRERSTRISEEDTKRVLITPVIEALGWAIYDTEEVRNEYRHASNDNPVDYALFLNRTPVLFVEAKALGQGLDDRKCVNGGAKPGQRGGVKQGHWRLGGTRPNWPRSWGSQVCGWFLRWLYGQDLAGIRVDLLSCGGVVWRSFR